MSGVNIKKTVVEAIPFYSIQHDTEPSFDLYYKIISNEENKKKFKKVLAKGDTYCSGVKAALAKKNTEELFIKTEDKDLTDIYNRLAKGTNVPPPPPVPLLFPF